jgi:hypothetical protein
LVDLLGRFYLTKEFKEFLHILFRDSTSSISHRELKSCPVKVIIKVFIGPVILNVQINIPFGCVFNSISEDVHNNLLDSLRVRKDLFGHIVINLKLELQILELRLYPIYLSYLRCKVSYLKGGVFKLKSVCSELSKIKHIVYHGPHLLYSRELYPHVSKQVFLLKSLVLDLLINHVVDAQNVVNRGQKIMCKARSELFIKSLELLHIFELLYLINFVEYEYGVLIEVKGDVPGGDHDVL